MVKLEKLYKLNNLEIIKNKNGDLYKGLSINDLNYKGFGEVYFTSINLDSIKAWKFHKKMTLNLIVLYGMVRFVFAKQLPGNQNQYLFNSIYLSHKNKQILTIPPKVWFGFKGIKYKNSLITNIANIKHKDIEVVKKSLKYIKFDWSKK